MSEHRVYLRGEYSPTTRLKRTDEVHPYGTFYDQIDVSGGYQLHFEPFDSPDWQAAVPVGLHYSRISGAFENNDSNRTLLAVEGGYRQYTPRLSILRLFMQSSLSVGHASNHLNFGKGTALPDQESLSAKIDLFAGLEVYVGEGFSFNPYVNFFNEWGVAGDPSYIVQGFALGLEISWDPFSPEAPPPEPEAPEPPPPEPEAPEPNLIFRFGPGPGLRKQLDDLAAHMKSDSGKNKNYRIKGYSNVHEDEHANQREMRYMVDLVAQHLRQEHNLNKPRLTVGSEPITILGQEDGYIGASIGSSRETESVCDGASRCVRFIPKGDVQ